MFLVYTLQYMINHLPVNYFSKESTYFFSFFYPKRKRKIEISSQSEKSVLLRQFPKIFVANGF